MAISACYYVTSSAVSLLSSGIIKTVSGTVYTLSRTVPIMCRAIPNLIKGIWFLIFNAGSLILKGIPLLGRAILYIGSLVFKAIPLVISAIYKAAMVALNFTPTPIISAALAILAGAVLYLAIKTGAIKVIAKLASCSCHVIATAGKITLKMGKYIPKAISKSGCLFKMAGRGTAKVVYTGAKSIKNFCKYTLIGLSHIPHLFKSNSYSIVKIENPKIVQIHAIRDGLEKASGSENFEKGLVKEVFEFLNEPGDK